jgi:NAD(P)-dependent dehydrogenase (short-subunit alcohol dehydrogenase family)
MALDKFSLAEQTIVVTGASSGIGRAVAIACARAGAAVALVGRNETELQTTATQCGLQGKYSVIVNDLANYQLLEEIALRTVADLGRISGFVHCAGIQRIIPLRAMRPAAYEETLSLNVIAGFELARILSKKKYLSTEGASFVYMSSVMGLVGEVSLSAYCASKGALVAGAKALALELAAKHIRVNAVCPGQVTATKMSASGFEALPESSQETIKAMHCLGVGGVDDVAYPVVFLLSQAARWVTGTSLVVDGGYSAR